MSYNTNNKPIRQGDLTFYPISSIPVESLSLQSSDVVAVGEGRDHFHKAKGQQVQIFEPLTEMQVNLDGHEETAFKFVRAQEEFVLSHETPDGKRANHYQLTIPKGDYVVLREREYDIFDEVAKTVMD